MKQRHKRFIILSSIKENNKDLWRYEKDVISGKKELNHLWLKFYSRNKLTTRQRKVIFKRLSSLVKFNIKNNSI